MISLKLAEKRFQTKAKQLPRRLGNVHYATDGRRSASGIWSVRWSIETERPWTWWERLEAGWTASASGGPGKRGLSQRLKDAEGPRPQELTLPVGLREVNFRRAEPAGPAPQSVPNPGSGVPGVAVGGSWRRSEAEPMPLGQRIANPELAHLPRLSEHLCMSARRGRS